MDLATGMDLVDDPQERLTYPVSPRIAEDFNDMDVKFSVQDAYNMSAGMFSNRKHKDEFAPDLGFEEFREAMKRKENAVFQSAHEGDLDERRMRR